MCCAATCQLQLQVFLRGGQMAVLDTMRTDIMHKAAVTIQRYARGLLVRRKVNRVRKAVIKIQVSWSMSPIRYSTQHVGALSLQLHRHC